MYAGDAGSPDTESWRAFLAQNVASVRVIDVLQLASADLTGADAVIVGGSPVSGSGREVRVQPAPQGITLDVLPLPTVLIGGMGGLVADQMNLKLGWRYG